MKLNEIRTKMSKTDDIRRTVHTGGVHVREREDGAPSRTITGYAIVFNEESLPLYAYEGGEDREVISPSAVTRGLLDGSDILMTMFHDRQLILARSKGGAGTLTYGVDAHGVSFEFDAPETADGEKALALVRRGDITGCSFAFSTKYFDSDYVTASVEERAGVSVTVHTVNRMTGIYDFTLTPDPAYPATDCEVRDLLAAMHRDDKPEDEKPKDEKPDDEEPEDEKPKDEKPDDEEPEDEKPKDEPDDEPEDDEPEDDEPQEEEPEEEEPGKGKAAARAQVREMRAAARFRNRIF